ncbi:tRNA (adenosine(37)-N6)-dimethylallyltransferase MiaA [Candidatus Nomurabacteria bacterium]|nr:tRNA (adenosine(37)-N6)-dimethylallyltransferase MiaA [Candidatus Nomurabacteria bacterium]
MNKPKVMAIVGPTSSGKTSLSIDIAKKFRGEVISADSRQVYRGMDLGTGKVTKEEADGIPHHLLDIADPMEVYNAAMFEHDAKISIAEISKRGNLPIITGGSSFYIDLLRGQLQSAPVPPNEEFRTGLEKFSNAELFKKIAAADPRRAEMIDPDNRHRLIRALEIINVLGVVPESTKSESDYNWLVLGVQVEKEKLHQNIHQRLEQRINDGMIEEVKRLHSAGLTYERMDKLGLEYRYVAKYLQNELSLEEMTEQLEYKIKQYAKRQMTWLKKDKEIVWVAPENREAIFRLVINFLQEQPS